MAEGRLRRRLSRFDQSLAEMPVHSLTDRVQLPTETVSPARRITVRVIYALAALFAAVLIVYIDRDGYRDSQE
ncbi:potassium transporter Kef, partial [Mycolicibacterium austroafricanum]